MTYIITDPTAGGFDPLPYCLPVDTCELGTGSGFLSEETAGLSVGDDCWLLLDDDDDDDDDVFFCWCNDNDVFDRSLEVDGVSLSKEDCGDLACDVLREGQCWRHKLLAMTRFWWSSCGNRPVTWYIWMWQVTYSSAAWTSESPGLLNYKHPLYSAYCLLLSSFHLHLHLFSIIQPCQSWFSHSSLSVHFTLKYSIFLTTLPRSIPSRCPIHSHLSFLISATISQSLYIFL